jgi:hypothetical protein
MLPLSHYTSIVGYRSSHQGNGEMGLWNLHITAIDTVHRPAHTTWQMYYRTLTRLLEATTMPHGARC